MAIQQRNSITTAKNFSNCFKATSLTKSGSRSSQKKTVFTSKSIRNPVKRLIQIKRKPSKELKRKASLNETTILKKNNEKLPSLNSVAVLDSNYERSLSSTDLDEDFIKKQEKKIEEKNLIEDVIEKEFLDREKFERIKIRTSEKNACEEISNKKNLDDGIEICL